MAFEVVIKRLAFVEIDEAALWYEKQMAGLSKRFLFALDNCIDKISHNPENYLIVSFPVRRILVKGFPYKLLYFILNTHEVVIIALIHTKRSNLFVRKRIAQ